MVVRGVIGGTGDQRQSAAAFGVGAHRHQHAAHVRVVDDAGRTGHRAVDRARLHAVTCVLHRLLVGPLGHRDALHADREARRVHHDEHVLEAAVLLADQVADRAAVVTELQHRGRAGLDAHLVLDRDAVHVVALAQRAVGTDHELRHDEQADALDALRRTGDARQHEVDDVLGHVVLAVGDEDLRAEDLVGAVGLRIGLGAHRGQIGAGLRFGQVHRAGPAAFVHRRQVQRLLLLGAGGQQRLDRAVGQQRAQREAQVGAVEDLAAGRADRLGQPLAAELDRVLQALPAAFAVLPEGVLEARRGGDDAVLPARGVLVTLPVQRRDDALVELRALLQHRLRGVQTGLGEGVDLRELVQTGQFLQAEQEILDGGSVGHFGVLWGGFRGKNRASGRKKGASASGAPFSGRSACRLPDDRRDQRVLTSSGTAANRSASRP